MNALVVLALLFAWPQSADKKDQPLVSATNPAYLACSVWTGKNWTAPTARSAKTPQKQSPKGFVAYADVKVAINGSECENTTTLYVASATGKKFRAVYVKKGSESDGNGIRLIGWSPNGDQLLAEVTVWAYETDTGYEYIPIIYSAIANSTKEILTLGKALDRFFGPDCEFEQSVRSWRNDRQIIVRVSRTPLSDEYEQHFCFDKPKLLAYDLQKDNLQSIEATPSRPK
jgi:hypothetical protein